MQTGGCIIPSRPPAPRERDQEPGNPSASVGWRSPTTGGPLTERSVRGVGGRDRMRLARLLNLVGELRGCRVRFHQELESA